MKRAYFISIVDDDTGVGVIAMSARKAKLIGFRHLVGELCCGDIDWTCLRVNWKRNVTADSIKDIPMDTVVDDYQGALIGLYGGLFDTKCPICGKVKYLTVERDKVGCEKCLYGE